MSSCIVLATSLVGRTTAELGRVREDNFSAMVAACLSSPSVRWTGLRAGLTTAEIREVASLAPDDLARLSPPGSTDLLISPAGPGQVLRSSGTSRAPKLMYHSWAFNTQVGMLGARGLRDGVRRRPKKIANWFYPSELMGGAFLFVQEIAKHLDALVFPVGSQFSVGDLLALVQDHSIDTLACTPAQCMDLVRHVGNGDLGSLSNILYIGEPMGSNRMEAIARLQPALSLRSLAYSTSETGPIGFQCAECTGTEHHVHSDAVLVEVVDEGGLPVADGEVGNVLVTPLSDSGMALFRYRVGDRATMRTAGCPCGVKAPLLTLQGREPRSANIDTKVISDELLLAVLEPLCLGGPGMVQVQHQQGPEGVEVHLVVDGEQLAGLAEGPEHVLAELRAQPQVRSLMSSPSCRLFAVVSDTDRAFVRTSTGKIPFFAEILPATSYSGDQHE